MECAYGNKSGAYGNTGRGFLTFRGRTMTWNMVKEVVSTGRKRGTQEKGVQKKGTQSNLGICSSRVNG